MSMANVNYEYLGLMRLDLEIRIDRIRSGHCCIISLLQRSLLSVC